MSQRKERMAIVFGLLIVAIAVICAFVVWLRWDAPPFHAHRRPNEIIFDVQTLGEYPTTINEIRLTSIDDGKTVWHIIAGAGVPQIHQLTLKLGINPAQMDSDSGSFRVVVPSDAAQFQLVTGKRYRIEVWGLSSKFSKQSAEFELKP